MFPRAPAEAGRPKTVRTETVPTMEPAEAANRAVSAAEQGARVLVIRNTVTMAVATWRAVIDAGAASLLMQVADGPALHHGRFAVEDRELLDRTVEEALGPVAEREPHGCIVIGTQTLEQSLDIDADLPHHRPLPDGRAVASVSADCIGTPCRGPRDSSPHAWWCWCRKADWTPLRNRRSTTDSVGGRRAMEGSTGSTATSRDWS